MSGKVRHIARTAELDANFKTGTKTSLFCGKKRIAIYAGDNSTRPVCNGCVDALIEEYNRPRSAYGWTTSTSGGNFTFNANWIAS